jgi:uncharacterized protein DUF6907
VSAPRTVTVQTSDHGPVTIPEPAWCTGQYHQQGGYRGDISHTSDDIEFNVETRDGAVTLMRAVFEQRPYTEREPGRGVFVAVELDGEWYPSDPQHLDWIANGLVEHAHRLRELGRQLAVMQEAGQ